MSRKVIMITTGCIFFLGLLFMVSVLISKALMGKDVETSLVDGQGVGLVEVK